MAIKYAGALNRVVTSRTLHTPSLPYRLYSILPESASVELVDVTVADRDSAQPTLECRDGELTAWSQ